MIASITKTYVRTYSDNGQRTLYVEWRDHRGKSGRTECPWRKVKTSLHMRALLDRARREGIKLTRETW